MPIYIPPELSGHKVAYRGRRYYVIEIDENHPFKLFDVNHGEFVVYDARDAVRCSRFTELMLLAR